MREFTVDVPVFVRVVVEADDAEIAAAVSKKFVEEQMGPIDSRLERVGGAWQSVSPKIVPVDDDDAAPDVYLCRGGKLAWVAPSGLLELTGEDCGR
jgi:hypothetical protein